MENLYQVDFKNRKRSRDAAKEIYDNKPTPEVFLKSAMSSIASFDSSKYAQITTLSKKSQIFINRYKDWNRLEPSLLEEYSKLGSFIKQLDQHIRNPESLPKSQTGDQLIKSVVSYNQTIDYRYMKEKAQTSSYKIVNDFNNYYEGLKKGEKRVTFDLETLAGTKENGAKTFDTITEIAYLLSGAGDNPETMSRNAVHFLPGINEDLYNKYMLMNDTGELGGAEGYAKVLSDRLGFYGRAKTEVTAEGLTIIKSSKDINPHQVVTKEDRQRGIKLLHEAWKNDTSTLSKDTGVTASDAKLIEMVQMLKSHGAVTWNGKRSDMLWMSRYIDQLPQGRKQAVFQQLGISDLSELGLDNINHLDMNEVVRFAGNNKTSSELYGTRDIAMHRSLYTVETAAHTLLPDVMENMVAHSAADDTVVTALLAQHENFLENIHSGISQTKDYHGGKSVPLTPGKQVFLAPKNVTTQHSPLDYIVEADGKKRLYAGYNVVGKTVQGENFNPSTLHKDGLYTITSSGKIDIDEKTRNAIAGINTDYALPNLYFVNHQAIDVGNSGGNSASMSFFKTEEEMMAHINSMNIIGEMVDGSIKDLDPKIYGEEYVNAIKQQHSKVNLKTGEIIPASAKDIADYYKELELTDRANRSIREGEIGKIKQLRKIDKSLSSKTLAGRHVESVMLQHLNGESYIAAKVAQGHPVLMEDMPYAKVIQMIGYSNDEGFHSGLSNTVDKLIGMSGYYYENKDVLDAATDLVENKFKGKSAYKQGYAFSYLMDALNGEIQNVSGVLTEDLVIPVKNTNYIEVLKDNLTSNMQGNMSVARNASQSVKENVLRVDLDGNNAHYNLISKLIKNRYGEEIDDEATRAKEAFSALREFKEALVGSKDKSIVENILSNVGDPKSYNNPQSMAEDIIKALRSSKQTNILSGIINTTSMQLPTDINANLSDLVKQMGGIEWFNNWAEEKLGQVNISGVTSKNFEQYASEISKKYFERTLSGMDPYEYAKQVGFNEGSAQYWGDLFTQSKSDFSGIMSGILKTITETGGELHYDEYNNRLFLIDGGSAIDITSKLPTLKVQGALMEMQLGNTKIDIYGKLVKDKKGNLQLQTNIKDAYDKALNGYGFSGTKKQIEKRGNSLTRLNNALTNLDKALRESPNLDAMTMQKQISNMRVDTDFLFQDIVQLYKQGKLNGVLNSHELETVKQVSIELEKGKRTSVSHSNVSATFRDVVGRNYDKLLYLSTGIGPEGSRKASRAANNAVKLIHKHGHEKSISEFIMPVGNTHTSFMPYINGQRITQGQNNFYSFDQDEAFNSASQIFLGKKARSKKEAERQLEKMGVSMKTYVNDGFTVKLNEFMELDRKMAYQISCNKVITSEADFKDIMNASITDKKIARKINTLNLLEDESIVNLKFVDTFFSKDYNKSIRSDIIAAPTNPRELAEFEALQYEFKQVDGHWQISYGAGVNKRSGDVLVNKRAFKDGKKTAVANYDGIFRRTLVSEQDGAPISEKVVNQYLKNASSEEEAREIVQRYFKDVYMLERSEEETYKKFFMGGGEKTKATAAGFSLGEYDETLKQDLLTLGIDESYFNKKTSRKDINDVLALVELKAKEQKKSKKSAKKMVEGYRQRIFDERYKVINTIQEVLKDGTDFNEEIAIITSERMGKHGGGREFLVDLTENLMAINKRKGKSAKEASQIVAAQMQKVMPTFKNVVHFGEDGSIVVGETDSYTDGINIKDLKEMLIENYKEYNTDVLVGQDLIVKDGRTVAAVTRTQLANASEHDVLSRNGPIEYSNSYKKYMHEIDDLKNKRSQNNREIKQYNKMLEDKKNPLSKSEIKEIKEKLSHLGAQSQDYTKGIKTAWEDVAEYKKSYNETFKGMSFSGREFLAMDSFRYDNTQTQLLKKKLEQVRGGSEISSKLFNNFLDKEGNLKTEFQDRTMLKEYVDTLKEKVFTETDHKQLLTEKNYKKALKELDYNPGMYEDMVELAKANFEEHPEMSIESLEKMYFINKSALAAEFNNGDGIVDIEMLQKKGFNAVDIEDVALAKSNDADLLSKGHSVYTENMLIHLGDNQYVASPYMLHSNYDNSIVQKTYQEPIAKLKSAKEAVLNAKTDDERIAAQAALTATKQEAVQSIKENSFGKKGVLTRMDRIRTDQSFGASASAYWTDYDALKTATFNGRSIAEWADDGIYLDAAFGGKEAFEGMGLLDEQYLKQFRNSDFVVGGEVLSKRGEAVTQEMMLQKLQTEGVAVFGDRYPTNLAGSLTPGMLYWDSELNGSAKTKIAWWSDLAKNGDSDGDKLYYSLAKKKMPNRKGVFTKQAKDSIQAEALYQDSTTQGFKQAMFMRGTGGNSYYYEVAKAKREDQRDQLTTDFSKFIKNNTINGELVPEFSENFMTHYTEDDINRFTVNLEELEQGMTEHFGEKVSIDTTKMENTNLQLEEFFESNSAAKEKEQQYREAIRFKSQIVNSQLAQLPKTRKGAIGEVDNISFMLKQEAAILYDKGRLTLRERESVNAFGGALTQAPISAKNAVDVNDSKFIENLRTGIVNYAHESKRSETTLNKRIDEYMDRYVKPNYAAGEVTETAMIFNDTVKERMSLEPDRSQADITEALNLEFYEQAKDDFKKMMSLLNNQEMDNYKSYTSMWTKVGTAQYINAEAAMRAIPESAYDAKDALVKGAAKVNDNFKVIGEVTNTKLMDSVRIDHNEVSRQILNAQNHMEDILAPNALTGKNLALTALGFASAYMITGFIGGNPAKSATTQASERSTQSYSPQYALSDFGGQYEAPQSTSEGYVININAQGEDRNVQRTIDNINQSISRSTSTNVSMQVSINEMTNFDNLKINKMLSRALD